MKKSLLIVAAIFSIELSYAQNTYPWPATGNVGIGTMNPASRLEVSAPITGADNYSLISRPNNNYTDRIVGFFHNANGNEGGVKAYSELYLKTEVNGIAFEPAGTERMRITPSGNVGIGTTTPTHTLTVNGTTSLTGPLHINNGNEVGTINVGGTAIQLQLGGRVLVGYDFHTLSDNVYIRNPDGTSFYGTFSSYTNSPRLKVQQISGKTDDLLHLADASNNQLFKVTNGGLVGVGTTTPTEKLDVTGNIKTTGYMLIGTTSLPAADAKLAVNGNIYSKKVKVTLNGWADYVFDAGYPLRPLSEVEQYIQQHHHLPEVPSAAEVKKIGLDLGDNQATLLKKIEELTLYIIEQNKNLEKQIKMNEEQDKQIKKLSDENKELSELKKEVKVLQAILKKN